MALALFDLDDTLIKGNCETAWFDYLAESGQIDPLQYKIELTRFDRLYQEGVSDIDDYMRFVLTTLAPHSLEVLHTWRENWLHEKVIPLIVKDAKDVLQKHRDAGDTLIIISASNTFCIEVIANYFEVDCYFGTDPIMDHDRFTGEFKSPACYAEHKITHLNTWLKQSHNNLTGSYFYTDSHNDLPLLELVENPIAVDADKHLSEIAIQRGWQSISLR